jgi:uncharacterized membrane protein YhaH (DUF805 family)
MGAFSIWHILILILILIVLIAGAAAAFLPLLIKPRGPNRFGLPAAAQTFPSAFVACLKKYVDFNGRAGRSEFWWYRLAVYLILAVAAIVTRGSTLTDIITLAFLLPDLAVTARRLHDLNRSGWWILLGFTVFGIIALIVLMAWPSQQDDTARVFQES